MAGKFRLTKGFRDIPLGNNIPMLIKSVSHDSKWGKIQVVFADEPGATRTETYAYVKDGKVNEVVLDVFATLAHNALDDWEVDDIDPEEIEGCYVIANVIETTGSDGKIYTHVRNFKPCGGFGADEGDEDEDPFD